MKKQTVTGELRKIISGLGKNIGTVYSDPRAYDSVGVKFQNLFFTKSEKQFIESEMFKLGFICRYIKGEDSKKEKRIYPYWTCSIGTRFCFFKKSNKKTNTDSQDSNRTLTYKEIKKDKDMKKFKVVNRMINLNISVPFQVGQVKGDAIVMIWFDGALKPDVDFADVENITYMDMKIEGYEGFKKLKDFHTELGIDLNKLIDEQTKSVMTDDVIKNICDRNL
jgi:hypothetical protein